MHAEIAKDMLPHLYAEAKLLSKDLAMTKSWLKVLKSKIEYWERENDKV